MVRTMLPLPMVPLRAAARRRQFPPDHRDAGAAWARHGSVAVRLLDGTASFAAQLAPAQGHLQTSGRRAGGSLSFFDEHGAVRADAATRGGISICRYSADLLQSAFHPRPLFR